MGITENYKAYNVISANGTYIIYVGSDGKIHIRWIRPDPPPIDVSSVITAATAVLHEAALVKDRALSEHFVQLAENLLNSNAKAIGGYLEHAGEAMAAVR
jgi:hypothetical protein